MAIDLRRECIGLGLDEVDLSRLDAAEQQRVIEMLEGRSKSILADIRTIIAALEERRKQTPSEEVADGFCVVMSHEIDPDSMATIISYSVKDIPGVVITRVNRNEIFYSAPTGQVELLRQKLAMFERGRGIRIGEGTLMCAKAS